ncbi:hypothetical protein [Sphingomonas sp. R1]|uniref:hypothetical protein n=1 Tax=Sphingomonas sp. R1 TaxID=399176 RepID=UPI002224BFA2|nr:hypothetical protein [Sphingomonas sp. R1]UYY77521.1 hypothetical protein OIM94_00460 [Sphingomonas sp. R1]
MQIEIANIDLGKFADFMLEEIDTNPDYEDDAFSVEYGGQRFYVERYPTHFYMETRHGEVFELPRH